MSAGSGAKSRLIAGAMMKTVGVHPLAGFDKCLHYKVSDTLCAHVKIGSLVRIPIFNRIHLGIVAEFSTPVDFPVERCKPLGGVVYPFPALPPDLLKLAHWMRAYYSAPFDSIIETMLPPAVRKAASLKQEKLLVFKKRLTPEELVIVSKRAPAQARLYEFLSKQTKPVLKSLALDRLGISASAIGGLVARGILSEESRRVERVAYADDHATGEHVAAEPHKLNLEQQIAVDRLDEALAENKFGVQLLFGVTGSGKTEVYLRAIQAALASGGGVAFLVPEVALTPQTVARLRARLEAIAPGHRAVVWHSMLSEGERLDGWLALATGEARVVVGARSAVFAPVQDLRLIVVDEEHEPAYKQDETPRYHGRDTAIYRAKLCGAVCLLGSATPSLETWANASAGKYGLLKLTQRIDDRKLPFIDVVDMRVESMRQRGAATLSRRLLDAMHGRLAKKEQTILFINRRGYSSAMQCRKCGHVEECPHCSVSMTYHRTDETLRCHLCGHQRNAPARCPSCASPEIKWRGTGTQRVEEAVRRVLPKARIERIDTDTMSKKNRFREVLAAFRAGRIDILVGTQMIAKGLDFPNVTLVGLVDADLSMHVPDFRANERTFQLLVQVAGRAGRGDRSGEVVVQTFTPEAQAIQFSRHADYTGFAQAELKVRRDFGYPPARHLLHHLFRGPNPEKLRFFAEAWKKRVAESLGDKVMLMGPAAAPIEKIQDEYRWQLWYFCNAPVTKIVAEVSRLRAEFDWPDDMIQVLDVDPVNLC